MTTPRRRPAPPGPRAIHARVIGPVQSFVQTEAAGGLAVLAAALIAFAWANSPWDSRYINLWTTDVHLSAGPLTLDESLVHLVNDGLMTLFFFLIGLETKRELLHGELAGRRKAALPVAAALGGMVLPALIYTAFNGSGGGAKGWGIPTATDIAFALGILALLGDRLPFALRSFLLALAVVDDIGAILIIAFFYTGTISLEATAWAIGLVLVALAARAAGIRRLDVYALIGLAFWFAVLKSGVHATIAGVILAVLTPASARLTTDAAGRRTAELRSEPGDVSASEIETLAREAEAPLERLERYLHPWVVFAVVPLFALANAGVALSGNAVDAAISSAITGGVVAALVLGKPAGILLGAWLASKTGIAALPAGVTWRHVAGAGLLGAIGFTVSLFVTDLAFDDALRVSDAKIGILAASTLAAILGYAWLRLQHAGTTVD